MKCFDRSRVPAAPAVLLIGALAGAPGFASDMMLTASAGTGVMYGVAKEFVYNAYQGKSFTESELDWDLRPLLFAKSSLALSTSVGFAASLDVRMGVPARTGSISDSDWLNYRDSGDYTKTNFSLHDAYSERSILLDAKAGWAIPLASWLTLEPYLAFGYMDFKWTARDGYLQYPPGYLAGGAIKPYPDSSTQPKVPVSGTGIIYQQTWLLPAAGIAAKLRLAGSFGGSVSFAFSPWVSCSDIDNHEFSQRDYYDVMMGGMLLEPRVSLELQVSANAWLAFNASYRYIAGLIGTTTMVRTGVGYAPGKAAGTYAGGAGVSFDALDASLGFRWML